MHPSVAPTPLREMETNMRTPGFTAESAIYQSQSTYLSGGGMPSKAAQVQAAQSQPTAKMVLGLYGGGPYGGEPGICYCRWPICFCW